MWNLMSSCSQSENSATSNSFLTSIAAEKESPMEASLLADEQSSKPIQDFAELCRLCAMPCRGLSPPVKLFQSPPHHPELLLCRDILVPEEEEKRNVLDMIRSTLPIKVSCCDSLPKQVCQTCLDRLLLTHSFKQSVLEAEKHLKSLSTSKERKLTGFSSNHPKTYYECPVCFETGNCSEIKVEANEAFPYTIKHIFNGNHIPEISIKVEPEDIFEPSNEELEQTYQTLFRNSESPVRYLSEDWYSKKPMKHSNEVRQKQRGRARSRPKLTPRSRRGGRRTCTTVEHILELNDNAIEKEDWHLEVGSGYNCSSSRTLTQCLLCERWFPGVAACLQHCLKEHLDSGAFLCPLCPRDDFPGDFELIEHYQEAHCPDLVLYEMHGGSRKNHGANTTENKMLKLGNAVFPVTEGQPDPIQSFSKEEFLHPQEPPWNAGSSSSDNKPELSSSVVSNQTFLDGQILSLELVDKGLLDET